MPSLYRLSQLSKPHHFIGAASFLSLGIFLYSAMLTQFANLGPLPRVAGVNNLSAAAPVDSVSNTGLYTLSVSRAGNGVGVVTETNKSLFCDSSCSFSLRVGEAIYLKAEAGATSAFTGWKGDCETSDVLSTCRVVMKSNKTVEAEFTSTAEMFSLNIARVDHNGTVISSPPGINCGSTCGAQFAAGTLIELKAQPDLGYLFTGWRGCEYKNETDLACSVRLVSDTTVSVGFIPDTLGIHVSKMGAGAGSVTSDTGGLVCGEDCHDYTIIVPRGTKVTLAASPSPGFYFDGWGDECRGQGKCQVTVNDWVTLNANFASQSLASADLVITNVEVVGTPRVGDIYFNADISITNQGSQTARFLPPDWIPWYAVEVVRGTVVAQASEPGSVIVGAVGPAAAIVGDGTVIAPGETKVYRFWSMQHMATRPDFLGTPGQKTIYFTLDPTNVVSELENGNNSFTKTFVVEPAIEPTPASLFVSSPSNNEIWRLGETKTIRWNVPSEMANYLRYIRAIYVPTGASLSIGQGLRLLGERQFSWTIPTSWPATGQFKIRLGAQPEGGTTPYADSEVFTIAPALINSSSAPYFTSSPQSPLSPNPTVGSVSDLRWYASDADVSDRGGLYFTTEFDPAAPLGDPVVEIVPFDCPQSDLRADGFCVHATWLKPGRYKLKTTVNDHQSQSSQVFLEVNVQSTSDETPTAVSRMYAPEAGYYAFKMNWFRTTAGTHFYNARDELKLAQDAVVGATRLKLLGKVNPLLTYLIYNPETDAMEMLYPSPQVSARTEDELVFKAALTRAYPAAGATRVIPLLGSYWGYCPKVLGPVSLGYYKKGEEIAIGHVTGYYGDTLTPKFSNDQDYYYIEHLASGGYRLWLDEGKHIGWAKQGDKSSYNDGSFDVYLVAQKLADVAVPLPVHSAVGEPYCGTASGPLPDKQKAVMPYSAVVASNEQKLRERIKQLEYQASPLEREVVVNEKQRVKVVDQQLTRILAGKILLQVEDKGQAWYVDKETQKKFYLKDGETAYTAMRAFGLGITRADLAKIPVGFEARVGLSDKDGDGVDDTLEEVLGTDPSSGDSDADGYLDGIEIQSGFDPLGSDKLPTDIGLIQRLEGKILLAVDDHGRAWYVNNGKRYYLKDGASAYQVMKFKSLGVTNENLRKISVGEFE